MKAAIILLVSLFGVAHSIRCFQCNSEQDSACTDPFSTDSPGLKDLFYQTCPVKASEGDPFCRKTKMWFEMTGEVRVHRDCGYKRREDYDCYQSRADDHVVDVCQCDVDGCNAATTTTTAAFTTTVMVACAMLAARM